MAHRALALAIGFCFLFACEVSAQRVGSWRNQPGTGAIVYDGQGRRIFWDDNGQLVGRYDFRTNRYENIDARLPGVGMPLASSNDPWTAARGAAVPPRPLPRRIRWPAIVYRGGKPSSP